MGNNAAVASDESCFPHLAVEPSGGVGDTHSLSQQDFMPICSDQNDVEMSLDPHIRTSSNNYATCDIPMPNPAYTPPGAENMNFSDPRPESKPEHYILYKACNFMPYTDRFHMLQNGSCMKLVDDNPRQSVVITDTRPPPYSRKQR